MEITASLVKELRERTGAGMMDCKKALNDANGDIEVAIEVMRKSGAAKAAKKAGRIAAEGIISIKQNEGEIVILEVNCETDFVAKDENFLSFVDEILEVITKQDVTDVDDLLHKSINDQTIEEKIQQLTAKIGEKLSIRRFEKSKINKKVGTYLHGKRIGVIVEIEGGDDNLAKDIAMHIAASKPLYVDSKEVSSSVLDKEKEIYIAQAQESGKPDDIIEKMVEGRLKKFVKEITLLGQPFVKDSEQSVEKILKSANAKVLSFIRYEVGEGIEKRVDNFAEEVMSQAKGN
ncbi:MAG: elongation factor Ts [Legionellales bacterium]|jgi:elongation factor Ts|nr:elongation factor Ts [Legionellales bacterium]|tara:strand:+ start:105 stop:974 length:870 start_codon:yes stop_codon:yes gene_type:complete